MQVPVFVANWEIECCQPPPGVGDAFEWRLEWVPGEDGVGVVDLEWSRVPRPADRRGQRGLPPEGTVIRTGPLTAWWTTADGPLSPVPSRGSLVADAHGLVPEGVSVVRGRVLGVQVVDQVFRRVDRRSYERVPGDFTLRSVPRSPRWFAHGWVPDADDDGEEGPALDREEDGVLLTVLIGDS